MDFIPNQDRVNKDAGTRQVRLVQSDIRYILSIFYYFQILQEVENKESNDFEAFHFELIFKKEKIKAFNATIKKNHQSSIINKQRLD